MENEYPLNRTYRVFSSRKGKFEMKLTRLDEHWFTGVITHGKAKAILPENVRIAGEEITLSRELTTLQIIT